MHSHITKHLAKNNIKINEKHGFRNKLSTITQLKNTTTDWANTLNNKGQADIICLDFSKAFDKISHKFILSKLHYYGIRNHTLSWIGAFLSNRTQTTVVNDVHSSYVEVTSGVSQGSVLGPMLLLLYINDINNAITFQVKLFADDSVLYRNIHDQIDQVILQYDLDTISSWAEKWLINVLSSLLHSNIIIFLMTMIFLAQCTSELLSIYIFLHTMKCIHKIEQIQRNSSFMNTVETLTPLFSLTG